MINIDNLKALLESLNFKNRNNVYSKHFQETDASLKVDLKKQEIIYPEEKGLTINERQTCNLKANENFVVFECVHRLLEKGYKPEHIELEPKWKLGHGSSGGRADILIKDNDGKPLLIIECKTPGREFDKAWRYTLQDGGQLFGYVEQIKATQFLCLYSSDFESDSLSYKSHIIAHRDNERYLADNPAFKSFQNATDRKERFAVWLDTYKLDYTTTGIFEDNIQPYHIGKDKYTIADLQSISAADQQKKHHEFATILRQHNVSGRENAFDKLINLFLCKLVDETENPDELKFYWKGVAYDTHFDLLDRLQQLYKSGMDKFLDEPITYIDQSAVQNAMRFIKQNPDATQKAVWHLFLQQKFFTNNDFSFIDVHNEKLFYQNAEVLLKILQMWQDIRLTGDNTHNQFLGDMFEIFLDKGVKQSEGQYFTPMPICRFILKSLPLESLVKGSATPPKAIDYACGAGHFLNELALQIKPLVEQHNQGNVVDYHKAIYGIEKEYRLSKVAKVSAFMYGQQEINICYGDALIEDHPSFKEIKDNSFDLLVANPPYSVRGFLETLPEVERDKYDLSATIDKLDTNNSIETFFIERAKQLLKAGGVAGIILPSSILSNGNNTYNTTRSILLKYFDIVAIAELGGGTFGKTGTNTVTLFLRRKGTVPDTADHYSERVEEWFKGCENNKRKQVIYKDEQLIEQYSIHIGVAVADYKTLLAGTPNAALLGQDTFVQYRMAFDSSTEISNLKKQRSFKSKPKSKQDAELIERFLTFVQAIERDKLYHFVLANQQPNPVLIIKSPTDSKAQKLFLGYDWSSAKGGEGIKPIKDTNGHHLTPLYDEINRNNPSKLNRCIADNFDGKLVAISAGLSEYTTTARLVDMLDFSRATFEKQIGLTVKTRAAVSTQWPSKLLREVTVINPSKSELKGVDPETIVSFVEMSSVNEGGYISKKKNRKLGELTKGSYTYFAEDDIILAKITPCMENGKCALGKGLTNGIGMGSSEFHVIRTDKNIILPEFALNFLNRAEIRKIAEINMTGSSGHRRVPESFYADLNIPLPPLDIQQQIVIECETVDAEIAAAQSAINTLQQTVNQKVIRAFGNHPMRRLDQISDLSRGASPRPINDYLTDDANGINWIKIGDVAPGAKYIEKTAQKITLVGAERSKFVKKGDFIISNSMSVGRPYLLAIDGCVHDGWLVLTNIQKKIDRDFLYYALSSGFAQEQFQVIALGGVVKNLNIDRAKGVKIPVPPLAEQQRLVAEVILLEKDISTAQAIIASAPDRKQAIMQRYL